MTTDPETQQALETLTDAIRNRLRAAGFDGEDLELRVNEALTGLSVVATGNGLAEILTSGGLDAP
jgi:hypothetical protein